MFHLFVPKTKPSAQSRTRRKSLLWRSMGATAAIFLTAILLSALPLSLTVQADSLLSPAFSVLESRLALKKCGLAGMDLSFSAEDFDGAVLCSAAPESVVSAITVQTLPDPAAGSLLLGESPVTAGQRISRSDLERLRFVPIPQEPITAGFTALVESRTGDYRFSCTMALLSTLNFAPSAAYDEETVSTYQSVLCFGSLSGQDPEGENVSFELLESPRKGILLLEEDGAYRYLPLGNFTGSDSFVYRCVDPYGNCSQPYTVTVQVNKNRSGILYSDLTGHPAAVSAITLAEKNLYIGTSLGDRYLFGPEESVSKEEFTALLLRALGIEGQTGDLSAYADGEQVTAPYAPYLLAAIEAGHLTPTKESGKLLLEAGKMLRESEALAILSSVTGEDPLPIVSVGLFDKSESENQSESENGEENDKLLTRGTAAIWICALLNNRA